MDICENEGVIMKIKDYYKLSSNAAVVLQTYSETWSDWIDIKVEDICDKDKINVIILCWSRTLTVRSPLTKLK